MLPNRPAKLRVLGRPIRLLKTQVLTPPAKIVDPQLLTAEHRAWRAEVIRRAGGRCQWVENGVRCTKAEPYHRMFADHIVERADRGALYDLNSGICLCGQHHTIQTTTTG